MVKNFTDEQIKLICEGLVDGDSARTIANKIDVECTLYFESYMSKIRNKKIWTNITKDYNFKETKKVKEIRKICELIVSGYTNYEICEKCGEVDDTRLYNIIRRIRKGERHRNISIEYGIVDSLKKEPDRIKKKKERIHNICECIETGMNSKDISIQLNESRTKSFINTVSNLRLKRVHKDVCRMYIFKRKYKNSDTIKMCEYMKEGKSYREIAKLMRIGFNPSFVSYLSKVKHGTVKPKITKKYNLVKEERKIGA